MTVENILTIIESLADYIVYFYPGYLTIYVFYFLKAKTLKDENSIIAKAIVISFLYKLCTDKVPLDKLPLDFKILYHLLLLLIAVAVPYLAYRIQKSKIIIDIFNVLKIATRFEDNELDLLDNQEISAWLKIYLKDDKFVYEGFLGEKELESGISRTRLATS